MKDSDTPGQALLRQAETELKEMYGGDTTAKDSALTYANIIAYAHLLALLKAEGKKV
jgi:hypothetical protein